MGLSPLAADVVYRAMSAAADDDYRIARWSACAGLRAQFLWSVAQAIEKYLKAILLVHKIAPDGGRHGLEELLSQISIGVPGLLPTSLSTKLPIEMLKSINQRYAPQDEISMLDFIRKFDCSGAPAVRYREQRRSEAWFWEIHHFDALVHSLKIAAGQKTIAKVSDQQLASFESVDDYARHLIILRFNSPFSGMSGGSFRSEARKALWWQNASIFPELLQESRGAIDGMAMIQCLFNSPFANADRLDDGRTKGDLEWLLETMKFSKSERQMITKDIESITGRSSAKK